MNKSMQMLGLAGAILAGSVHVVSADPVVFNVNMSVQTALGTFNAAHGDVVSVLGLTNDWATGIDMTATADPDVYTVTAGLAAGSWPNYKFVIKPAGGAWIWETPASTGGGNRWLQVPAGGTNLPVVFFSDVTNVPSYTVDITFQVSMQYAIVQGQFTQGADYVSAFGSFDNWGTTGVLLTNVPGTSNYVGTFTSTSLTTNTVVSYKYAINGNGGTWEGNVGPNGAQNRSFTLTSTNQVLPLDYWNNVTSPVSSTLVAFTVNMAAEDAFGIFSPAMNTVFVNGDWNWSGSAAQLMQVGTSDVYTGAVEVAIAPGMTVNYKYTIDGGFIWENDGVGPGGAKNHQFVMNTATNLPMDYFNNQRDLGALYISRQGSETVLTWPSGTNVDNRIRLQNALSLLSGWADVPEAAGQSSITNNFGAGPMFFRLIGP